MKLKPQEQMLLSLLRMYFSGEGDPPAADADWASVFSEAEAQHLMPIVYDAVRNTQAEEKNRTLFAYVRRRCVELTAHQIVLNAEYDAITARMRCEGLHPVSLKGPELAALYPDPLYRQSVDFDLLIPEEEFSAARKILESEGYRPAELSADPGSAYEVCFRNADGTVFAELHRGLFHPDDTLFNTPFENLGEITEEQDGIPVLTPQMHLLYLLMHACKHFISGGMGLRMTCDIALWMTAYRGRVDTALLYRQCREAQIEQFCSALFSAADTFLGFRCCPEEFRSELSPEPLLEDMLEGGVYGTRDRNRIHASAFTLNSARSSRRGAHSSGFLKTVFPGFSYMAGRYPFLQKRPFLLPAAWLHRLVRYFLECVRFSDGGAGASLRLGRKRLRLLKYYRILSEKTK